MFGNGKNRYTCRKCGGQIVTRDRDEGVTPFLLDCRVSKQCLGWMESAIYRGVGDDEVATFEWRKPTQAEYRAANQAMRQHFDRGGLDIYPVISVHAAGDGQ